MTTNGWAGATAQPAPQKGHSAGRAHTQPSLQLQPQPQLAERKPSGYWTPFNVWWREFIQQLGRRPGAEDITW